MNSLEFLRSREAQALLARAAKAAGTPLCLYQYSKRERNEHQQASELIQSWGSCEACQYVNQIPEGRSACQANRHDAASKALRRGAPVRYLCHMGFACVTAPALSGTDCVLTFGPYCPQDDAHTLGFDALRRLSTLEKRPLESLPVSLEDIHRAPPASVPSVAAWTVQSVEDLRDRSSEPRTSQTRHIGEEAAAETEPCSAFRRPLKLSRNAVTKVAADPFYGRQLAAAAAAGRRAELRRLLEAVVSEHGAAQKAAARATLLAALGAALTAAARAGMSTTAAWTALPKVIASADENFAQETVRVLSMLKPQEVDAAREEPELEALLQNRLVDPPTLEEAAKLLNARPSTLAERLKRRYGVGYSGFVARMRLAQAKDYLRRTNLSVAQVARRVGISDPSNLTRLFRKFEATTPQQYREQFGSSKWKRNQP